jgi:hypothetical protein
MLLLLFLCIITTTQTNAGLQETTNHTTNSATKSLSQISSYSSWDTIDQHPCEILELEENVTRMGLELNRNNVIAGISLNLLRSAYQNQTEQSYLEASSNKSSTEKEYIMRLSENIIQELYKMERTECSFSSKNELLNILIDAECIYNAIISKEMLIQKHHKNIFDAYNKETTEV